MNNQPMYLGDLQKRYYGDVMKFSCKERTYAFKFFTDHGHESASDIEECMDCVGFYEEYNMCKKLNCVENVIKPVIPISSEGLVIPEYKSIYPGLAFPFFDFSFSDIHFGKKLQFLFWGEDLKFRTLFKNLLKNLGQIHELGIIHCDIKPRNILFNDFCDIETKFVIIDFGNSIYKKDMLDVKDDPLTTSGYITPEMILGKEFDETIDVYAIAITMINIYTRKKVFQWFEKTTIKTKRIELHERKNYGKIIENLEIEDDLLVDLLIKMLKYDRKDRFTVNQCLQHIFFKKRRVPKKEITLPPIIPDNNTGKKRKRKDRMKEEPDLKKQKTTL